MWYKGRILLSGLGTCSWGYGQVSGGKTGMRNSRATTACGQMALFLTPHGFIPLCRVALLRLMPVIKQVDIRANTNLRGTYMALRNSFFPSIYFDSISQKSVIIYWFHGSKTPYCWKNVKMSRQTLIAEMGMVLPWDTMLRRSQRITCSSLYSVLVATALVYNLFIQTWSGRGRLHRRAHPWVQCESDKHLHLPLKMGTVRF